MQFGMYNLAPLSQNKCVVVLSRLLIEIRLSILGLVNNFSLLRVSNFPRNRDIAGT
jgi:hypothetical protein